MNSNKKILVITGDAGESFEILYASHRLREAGYETVIAAPAVKRMNLVIHDFEPGWDTYVERKGYLVESQISFDEVDPARLPCRFVSWRSCSGIFTQRSESDRYHQRIL